MHFVLWSNLLFSYILCHLFAGDSHCAHGAAIRSLGPGRCGPPSVGDVQSPHYTVWKFREDQAPQQMGPATPLGQVGVAETVLAAYKGDWRSPPKPHEPFLIPRCLRLFLLAMLPGVAETKAASRQGLEQERPAVGSPTAGKWERERTARYAQPMGEGGYLLPPKRWNYLAGTGSHDIERTLAWIRVLTAERAVPGPASRKRRNRLQHALHGNIIVHLRTIGGRGVTFDFHGTGSQVFLEASAEALKRPWQAIKLLLGEVTLSQAQLAALLEEETTALVLTAVRLVTETVELCMDQHRCTIELPIDPVPTWAVVQQILLREGVRKGAWALQPPVLSFYWEEQWRHIRPDACWPHRLDWFRMGEGPRLVQADPASPPFLHRLPGMRVQLPQQEGARPPAFDARPDAGVHAGCRCQTANGRLHPATKTP